MSLFEPAGGVGTASGGPGGAGVGGIPAAILFESGLSAPDRAARKWKGLLIGLERVGAGPDYVLATQARNPTASTQATYTLASGANSITITLPTTLAVGAAGNDWDFVTEASSDNVARIDQANRRIVVRTVGFGLSQLAGWINAVAGLSGAAVVTGDGNTNFVGNAVPRQADFSGGVTEQKIGATIDADATPPVVTLIYDNADTQMECRDAWDELAIDNETLLRCSELGSWNSTAAVESRTSAAGRAFDLFFSEGAIPAEQELEANWNADRLRLQLKPKGDPIELETPDGIGDPAIEMVVTTSPGSFNKSNPPRNFHITVITPPNKFPTAELLNMRLDAADAASVNYDPRVSVHTIQRAFSENARNDIAGHLVGQFLSLRIQLLDGSHRVVHEEIRNIEVVEETPLDPKILVGTLQWDVTPASIAGVTADDLEGTYRAQFDTPYFPLTEYYFEAFIKVASGTAQSIRDRAQWVQVTHLDLAIDATEAGQIARDVFTADDDHFDIELHFFTDAVTLGAIAVTSRRIRIGATSSGSGPDGIPDAPDNAATIKRYELYVPADIGDAEWRDATAGGAVDEEARTAAGRAQVLANQNDRLITGLQKEVSDVGKQAIGQVNVNPGHIDAAADLDGTYQCIITLTDAEVTQLTGAGVNYLEMWFGTEAVQIVSPWAPALATRVDVVVDTTEESAIGAPGNALAVRAVYRINQGGNQAYYAEGSGALRVGGYSILNTLANTISKSVEEASDIGYATVASGAELDVILAAQANSAKPRLVLFTAAINNHRYQGGAPFNIVKDQVRYFKPRSVTGVNFFVLPGGADSGQSASQVQAAIAAALPPFADIRLLPEALPGSQVPDDFYLELAGKLTDREIDGLTLVIAGQTIQPHASTPVAGFDTETQALIRFDISTIANTIANSINAADRTLSIDLTFSFTEGDDFTRRILLPVNNPNAPRLVQGELDTIIFNAATTLDWLAPDMRTITLTADITFTFSNILVGRPLVLEIIQNATGGNDITWPSSVEWAGGAAEGPTATGNAKDIYTLLPLSSTRVLATALLDVK